MTARKKYKNSISSDQNTRAIRHEKRVLKSREKHSPCAGDELPASISRTAKRFRRSWRSPSDKNGMRAVLCLTVLHQ